MNTFKSYLERKLQAVEINGSTKEVKFDNLKERNTDYEEKSYRSFVFSVGYQDKGIVENKSLWPLYSVINNTKCHSLKKLKIVKMQIVKDQQQIHPRMINKINETTIPISSLNVKEIKDSLYYSRI